MPRNSPIDLCRRARTASHEAESPKIMWATVSRTAIGWVGSKRTPIDTESPSRVTDCTCTRTAFSRCGDLGNSGVK